MPGAAGASGNPRQGKAPSETGDQEHLARTVRGHFRFRALPFAQRHRDPEILPQHLERGAAQAVSRPAGAVCEELEIFDGRYRRARAVAQIHGRLSRPGQTYFHGAGAMVRGARRSQMVRAGGDRLGDRQHVRGAEPAVSANRQGVLAGVQTGARGAAGGRQRWSEKEGRDEDAVKVARRVAKVGAGTSLSLRFLHTFVCSAEGTNSAITAYRACFKSRETAM